jgi:hypothetical protein
MRFVCFSVPGFQMKKPFLSYRPTEETIRDHEYYRFNRLFFGVAVLSFCQMCAMALLVVVLFSSPELARSLFGYLAPAVEYVPVLVKYRQVLPESKTPFDFATVSSIYILFLAMNVAAIVGLAGIIFRNFPRRLDFKWTMDVKFRLFVAACFFVLPTLLLVYGAPDLRYATFSANRIFFGSFASAFVAWCFFIPAGNFFSIMIVRLALKPD